MVKLSENRKENDRIKMQVETLLELPLWDVIDDLK